MYVVPLPWLSQPAHTLAAILTWVVIFWVTEPIPLPVTGLLGTSCCVMLGLGSIKEVYSPYAHPIIFLFIGSFFLAEGLKSHSLDKRFARWILSLEWVGSRPGRLFFAIGSITAVLSMWISNTCAVAMMLPMVLGLLNAISGSEEKFRSYNTGLMLFLAYGAGVGGVATIIGTPPNIIGVGFLLEQTGIAISFFEWMALGLPVAVMMLLGVSALLSWLYPVPPGMVDRQRGALVEPAMKDSWTRGELNACVAFGTAVCLWIFPGVVAAFGGPNHDVALWFRTHLPKELVAILAAGLLFILPVDLKRGEFTLSWKRAANINWGIILLFGAGLAFGHLMIETNLAASLGEGLVGLFGVQTLWGLTAVAIVAAILLTELASNTAAASMLVPVVIAIAQAADVSPLPPTIAACMAASLAFVLPVSTPPNAIVYGTGLVPILSMVRAGLMLDLLGGILIWLLLRLLCPIFGMT